MKLPEISEVDFETIIAALCLWEHAHLDSRFKKDLRAVKEACPRAGNHFMAASLAKQLCENADEDQ